MRKWEEIASKDNSAQAKMCNDLLLRFSNRQELLEPADDYEMLLHHKDLIDEAMATIFPISLTNKDNHYAAAVPFAHKVIYGSSHFNTLFVDRKSGNIINLDPQVEKNITSAKLNLAYKLILKKYYNIDLPGSNTFICAYPSVELGIYNYFELEMDPQFIDINADIKIPVLPDDVTTSCLHVTDLVQYPRLLEVLPLEHFVFDGIIIIHIYKVTEREATNRIKEILDEGNLLEEHKMLSKLQEQVRFLLGMKELEIGVASYSDEDMALNKVNEASLLMKDMNEDERTVFVTEMAAELNSTNYFQCLTNRNAEGSLINRYAAKSKWQTVFVLALRVQNKLIGWLEMCSETPVQIHIGIIDKVQKVVDLLSIAIQKDQQQLQNEIDQLIKENFTAVQSSVEWMFREAAFDYFVKQQKGEETKMRHIVFDQVYPLYALIDIRNSSGERNQAIQRDMVKQLEWVKKILVSAQQYLSIPLLNEVELRVDEYITAVSNFLFASDEHAIQAFLQGEAEEMLRNLKSMQPSLSAEINEYFDATLNQRHLLTTNQQKYELSVTEINNSVSRFLDREQNEAQSIFPHYFERFVTDGVEFNMYIGQSIAPDIPFNRLYLKNLRLWQLHFLALAAQRIKRLQSKLPIPLETTQLILVHNDPLSISFRAAERKFDVDGVYNARYEVMKKRIDKVHIRDTNERLTRPGSIAIVYSGEKEAQEYLQYIHYLKKKHLLEGDPEIHELEELQGVSGLKAIRVEINMAADVDMEVEKKKKLVKK